MSAALVPTISVCMPVYNAAEYLAESVGSILSQTFADFEFIVIDDGSTDASLATLKTLTANDARVKIISRPNTGYSKALNEAVQLARGDFLARMDADDISLPQRFEKQVAFLRTHPEVLAVGSHVMTIDPYSSPLYEPRHETEHDAIVAGLLAGVGWSIVHPAVMMRRDAVLAVGAYRTEIEPSEDLDLFLRLSEHGRLANLPDILLHYRQHAKSVNHTRVAQQDRNKLKIMTDFYARKGQPLPAGWTTPKRKVLPIEREIDMWGWSALRKGNISAARKHAVTLLKLAPFSTSSWRLMYCAVRGR